MTEYSIIPRTAYPLFAEVKPEVYNCTAIDVHAASVEEAARIAVTEQREAWGAPGETGTFRFAVIARGIGFNGGDTVTIVDVEVKPATVTVGSVEVARDA